MAFTLSDKYLGKFISTFDMAAVENELKTAFDLVKNKNGEGSDFLGWVNLPYDHNMEEYERIKDKTLIPTDYTSKRVFTTKCY